MASPATHPLNLMVVSAARGIGLALVEALLRIPHLNLLYASCRTPHEATALQALALAHPQRLRVLALDVTREGDFAIATDTLRRETDRLHGLIYCAGLLHDEASSLRPERRVEDIDAAAMARSFAVNATGVALAAKHCLPLLSHGQAAWFASLSARVGSITDNRLGGWYAYRASKAAQNQIIRTLAVEAARRAPRLSVVALHPGTVATELSAPFSANLPAGQVKTPQQAAAALLAVLAALTPEQSGQFFAWDGRRIPF